MVMRFMLLPVFWSAYKLPESYNFYVNGHIYELNKSISFSRYSKMHPFNPVVNPVDNGRCILKLMVYWWLKLIKHVFSIKPICSFKNFIPDAFFGIVYLTHTIAGAPAWTVSKGFGASHWTNKSCST